MKQAQTRTLQRDQYRIVDSSEEISLSEMDREKNTKEEKREPEENVIASRCTVISQANWVGEVGA